MKKSILILMALAIGFVLSEGAHRSPALAGDSTSDLEDSGSKLHDIESLGKVLFFDPNLSVNRSQSCASCHDPAVGFTSPDSERNARGAVEPGDVPGRFGNRKPPSAAYAGESPLLSYDEAAGGWFGGMFWDGRAVGWRLGDPLAEQAMGPFVYERIARSIAAYERSVEVNAFTSKFDVFWENAKAAGKDITKMTCASIPGGMGGGSGGMGGGGMSPDPSLFPEPEPNQNRIVMQPFNFMMNGAHLVAFLWTLSDGYVQR